MKYVIELEFNSSFQDMKIIVLKMSGFPKRKLPVPGGGGVNKVSVHSKWISDILHMYIAFFSNQSNLTLPWKVGNQQ